MAIDPQLPEWEGGGEEDDDDDDYAFVVDEADCLWADGVELFTADHVHGQDDFIISPHQMPMGSPVVSVPFPTSESHPDAQQVRYHHYLLRQPSTTPPVPSLSSASTMPPCLSDYPSFSFFDHHTTPASPDEVSNIYSNAETGARIANQGSSTPDSLDSKPRTSLSQQHLCLCLQAVPKLSRGSSSNGSSSATSHPAPAPCAGPEGHPLPPLLHVAARSRNRNVAATLLKYGASMVDQYDEHGQTALHIAASLGDEPLVSLLLRHGADANLRDSHGQNPLFLAVSAGHNEVVVLLLRNGGECR